MNTTVKQVKGFPDYTISIDGELINTKTNYKKKFHIGANGYLAVALSNDGYMKSVTMHRLIATHFIPNPENKRTVNHIDGVKTNNDIRNLEWATDSENCLHAYRHGLSSQEKLHTEEELLSIFDRFKDGESFESISKDLECATSAITVNLRKLLIKQDKEEELDRFIKINNNASMKLAGVNKRNLITLKMIDKKTLNVVKVFNSVAEAQEYLGKSSSGPIVNAVSKRAKSGFGYHWVSADNSITNYQGTSEEAFWRKRNSKGNNNYIGIRFRKDTSKYSCYIKSKSLGCYNTEKEALEVRNKYVIENGMPEEIQKIDFKI